VRWRAETVAAVHPVAKRPSTIRAPTRWDERSTRTPAVPLASYDFSGAPGVFVNDVVLTLNDRVVHRLAQRAALRPAAGRLRHAARSGRGDPATADRGPRGRPGRDQRQRHRAHSARPGAAHRAVQHRPAAAGGSAYRPENLDLGGAILSNGDGLLLDGHTLYVVQNLLNRIAVVRDDEPAPP
jgi:hypothetical protein